MLNNKYIYIIFLNIYHSHINKTKNQTIFFYLKKWKRWTLGTKKEKRINRNSKICFSKRPFALRAIQKRWFRVSWVFACIFNKRPFAMAINSRVLKSWVVWKNKRNENKLFCWKNMFWMSKLACLIFEDNQESLVLRKTKLFRVKIDFG